MSPPGWLFSRLDFGTATAGDKDARRRGRRCQTPTKRKGRFWITGRVRARGAVETTGHFPDLKEIKQPMPNPLPGDPEMPDEEEEEKERKENPGEPGEDEEEDENGEKISKKEKEETREGGRERGVKRKTEEARRGVILSSSRYVVTRYARTLITLYYDV